MKIVGRLLQTINMILKITSAITILLMTVISEIPKAVSNWHCDPKNYTHLLLLITTTEPTHTCSKYQ
jgi:hypothetical protein